MEYAALMLDLDGVVYVGSDAVPYAIDALNHVADRGVVLSAATNNANRPATEVWAHLHALGLHIDERHVMTSAQATARHVAGVLPAGASVLAVGGDGVASSLRDVGLAPLRASEDIAHCNSVADAALAVVVGYGPKVAWFDLAAAHWAIERGRPWFATNTDATVPLPYGRAPGNGAVVGLLERSTGRNPVVIGKPMPGLFDYVASSLGTRDVLVIGDRLDTDIDGAVAAGFDSLFVLTGVHGLADLAARPLGDWPTFVAVDLRSLRRDVVRIRWSDGLARADSVHPFVTAVIDAVNGRDPGFEPDWGADAPLVDLRAVREAGTVGP